jgi:hypothetical protein
MENVKGLSMRKIELMMKEHRSKRLKEMHPKFVELVKTKRDDGMMLDDILSEALDNNYDSLVYWMIDVYYIHFENIDRELLDKKLN